MSATRFVVASLAAAAGAALAHKVLAETSAAAPGAPGPVHDTIDAYVERQMRRLRIPGAFLAIVEGDALVHTHGFGRARPGGAAPTPQTPFFIGSLTKSITATAVMQLVEAGRIDLDAPVQRYLPWFQVADAEASAQITVRHLLNQTSGLPESAGDAPLADADDRPDAAERQARALATLRLTRRPGAACEYCNMNYNLLGLIVEATTGQSYAAYIHEHILAPLDMRRTYTSRATARANGLAMGHRFWFGVPIPAPNLPVPHGSLASGQLMSSAEDLAHYLIAHMNGGRYGDVQLVSSAGINELHRGAAAYSKMGVSAGTYAMGWFDGQIGRTRVVWHSGTNPDFGAYMALLPERKQGVVLLFNAGHWWYNPLQTELGMAVTALLAGERYAATPFPSIVPWMLPGQLLIPALQVADVVGTRRMLQRWRREPESRPSGGRCWWRHALLPLIPNLLAALALKPMLGARRGYVKLFMPDFSLLATVCGSFALVWSVVRTALLVTALRRSSSPAADHGR